MFNIFNMVCNIFYIVHNIFTLCAIGIFYIVVCNIFYIMCIIFHMVWNIFFSGIISFSCYL